MGILSVLVFLPVAGCLALLFWPRERENGLKWLALLVSLADLVVSLDIYRRFRTGVAGMQLEENIAWVRSLGKLLMESGKSAEALAAFLAALDRRAGQSAALLGVAQAEHALGNAAAESEARERNAWSGGGSSCDEHRKSDVLGGWGRSEDPCIRAQFRTRALKRATRIVGGVVARATHPPDASGLQVFIEERDAALPRVFRRVLAIRLRPIVREERVRRARVQHELDAGVALRPERLL